MSNSTNRNIKDELIKAMAERTVCYGKLMFRPHRRDDSYARDTDKDRDWTFNSHSEFCDLLSEMDINYDASYGGQELFGIVVFTYGTWISRGEYDGSEWWENHQMPTREFVLRMTESS